MRTSMRGKSVGLIPMVLLAGVLGAAGLKALNDAAVVQVPFVSSTRAIWLLILVAPIVEELAFRQTVQGWLKRMLVASGVAHTAAMFAAVVLTAVAFAACHLLNQSASLAILVIFPALIFGLIKEFTGSVVLCMVVHAWFNTCFLMIVATK